MSSIYRSRACAEAKRDGKARSRTPSNRRVWLRRHCSAFTFLAPCFCGAAISLEQDELLRFYKVARFQPVEVGATCKSGSVKRGDVNSGLANTIDQRRYF